MCLQKYYGHKIIKRYYTIHAIKCLLPLDTCKPQVKYFKLPLPLLTLKIIEKSNFFINPNLGGEGCNFIPQLLFA